VTGYGLDDRGSITGGGRDYSLCYNIQITSGAHPASYPRLLWVISSGCGQGVKLTTYFHLVKGKIAM